VISQKSIQEVLDTVRVEDIIQEFVPLRRRGAGLLGNCPFHHEKTPSFHVSPSRNIYKCFGCGKAGNSVHFLMEHEHLSFPEAIRHIAARYNIELEETRTTQEMIAEKQENEAMYLLNQFAMEYYRDQMYSTDEGRSIALSYFKERGFSNETIQQFGLGYAPQQRDAFYRQATGAGYAAQQLYQLGLCSPPSLERNLPPRDFFRARVIFPIHSQSGKVIAFAGRIMASDAKAPKYINSPETEIYIKSKVLYGAFQARRAIREQNLCILVEGYTDVISLHQAGIQNVVASSGTALTVDQIGLIKRNTPNIRMLYDGDPAGIKAALRGLDLVLEQDMNVDVVLLPEGEDPDSYVKKVGKAAFAEYLVREARDVILFKTHLLMGEAGTDPVKRSAVVRDIVGSMAKIPDPVKRSFFVQECSKVTGVEEAILMSETNKLVLAQISRKDQAGRGRGGNVRDADPVPAPAIQPGEAPAMLREQSNFKADDFQEKDLARIIVAFGKEVFDEDEQLSVAEFIISNIEEVLDDFDNPEYAAIVKAAHRFLADEEKAPDDMFFIHHPDPAISKLSIDLLAEPYEYSENWEKKWEILLRMQPMPSLNFTEDSVQALKRFKLRKIEKVIQQNLDAIKEHSQSGEEDKLQVRLNVHQKLLAMRNDIAGELGTVIIR
jgi:DNA primase